VCLRMLAGVGYRRARHVSDHAANKRKRGEKFVFRSIPLAFKKPDFSRNRPRQLLRANGQRLTLGSLDKDLRKNADGSVRAPS
jgi:hypothetical protein